MRLEAISATKTFRGRRGSAPVTAVKAASIVAEPGKFTAIVGESGSGKSTLARMLLGLIPVSDGGIELDGVPIDSMNRGQRRHFRTSVQAVLQDPAGSLNPRKSVGRAIAEIIRLHRMASSGPEVREKVEEVLELVRLTPASDFIDRYPSELSGGQRQRVLIARAIALNPQIIVADEAVSALDASVKAGVLRLLRGLTERIGVGYVFITHDLPVVKKVADEVHVMRNGEIVESGPTAKIFGAPEHPYTKSLLESELTLEAIA